MRHKAIIETNGVIGKITIDGNEIGGVTGYTITHNGGSTPELTLKFNCDIQVVNDGVLLPLPEPWREFYEKSENPLIDLYK